MARKKKTPRKAWAEPRLAPEKIAELALGIFQGRIFTSTMVRESDVHLLPCIFLPLGFLSKEEAAGFNRHPPWLFYGSLETAFPRSINGYPLLSEMGVVYKQDAKLLQQKFEALVAAAKEVLKS